MVYHISRYRQVNFLSKSLKKGNPKKNFSKEVSAPLQQTRACSSVTMQRKS